MNCQQRNRAGHGIAACRPPNAPGAFDEATQPWAAVADICKSQPMGWLSREPAPAKLRTHIRRVLAVFGYPWKRNTKPSTSSSSRWRPSRRSGPPSAGIA